MFREINKRDTSILIGNTLDHFDTSIYSFLAPMLAPIFFPKYDPIVQLILAYSILATSLVTRPLGAFVFGILAKKYGPVICLSYSLIGVAITTVLIGLIPEYAAIGWFSTFALIAVRMIKGLFAAGESTIAKLYIMEGKISKDAFRSSYLYQGSTVVGIILASLASTIIFHYKDYPSLWRLCFLLGGTVGVAGYLLRKYADSNNIIHSLEDYKISSLRSLAINWKVVLIIAVTTGMSHVTYYIPFVVMNNIVPLVTSITLEEMMAINTILLVFDVVAIYVLGRLLVNINFQKIIFIAAIILAVSLPIMFSMIDGANILYISFVRIWIVLWGVVFLCPLNLYYKKLVENSNNQYFIVGMSGALGTATIGRITPALSLWLWHTTNKTVTIGLYVGIIALLVVFLMVATPSLKE